jgi:hypothetical protein
MLSTICSWQSIVTCLTKNNKSANQFCQGSPVWSFYHWLTITNITKNALWPHNMNKSYQISKQLLKSKQVINNSTHKSPSWEAYSHSTSREINRFITVFTTAHQCHHPEQTECNPQLLPYFSRIYTPTRIMQLLIQATNNFITLVGIYN